jgi:hypothetical protein
MLITFVVLVCASTLIRAEKYSNIRITVRDRADFERVKPLGLDIVNAGAGYVDAIVPAGQLNMIKSSGLTYATQIEDMTAFYQSRFDKSGSMGGYRTLAEIGSVLDSIANAHPSIVTPKTSIGNSIEGRPIWLVKISDNPMVDEAEPKVYYYACHHAREVITPEVLIYFMRYLTNNYGTDPQVTYLVNNRELYFSPCLNPDGYAYNQETDPSGGGMWRKNRRNSGGGNFGVDINRNYGYQWGYDDEGSSPDPSSLTYRGSAAFSEPEIQAERLFINSKDIKVVVNYHSYSNYFLYPWGYEQIYSPDNDIFVAMGDTVHAMNGYTPGTPWAILYPVNGGAFDWEYGEQGTKPKIYATSVEVGTQTDGFWPATSRIAPLVQENLAPNLFYARVAGHPEALRAPVSPVIVPIGDIDSTHFRLYWSHHDIDNPAVSFEVWQHQNLARIIDSLESGVSRWTANGFTLSTTRSHSVTHSYFSGNADNLNNRLTVAQTLKVAAGDSLKFWAWYNIESGWDHGYVEVSTNGGSTWATIPGNITTIDNPHGLNAGYGITGNSSGWVQAKFNLGSFVGSDILYRFRYATDGYTSSGGWFVDDIGPVEFFNQSTQLAAATEDTTLLVEGLSNGEYFYQVRAKDPQNQLSAFSPLALANVFVAPTCTWLVGDADNSGMWSITDAVSLVAYVFSDGPAPIPNAVGSGDADCNGVVNITDVVYLIAYIFAGGAAPGSTCDCTNY